MIIRRVWNKIYALASHLACIGVTLWGVLFWFALREHNVDLTFFVVATVVSLGTSALALLRVDYERRVEKAYQAQAWREARYARQVRHESDRRKAARLARIERRERSRAEADTEALPVWLVADRPTTVYRSLRNTADDELRMRLRLDFETPTGDINVGDMVA